MKVVASNGGLPLGTSIQKGDFPGQPLCGSEVADHAAIDEGRIHPLKSAQPEAVHELPARRTRRVFSDNVEAVGIMGDIAHPCRSVITSLFRK